MDDEIKGEGNSINYTFRMHDPRAGRFFATDPLEAKYPWYSPYQFSGNRVIDMVELEGLEPADAPYKNKEGTVQVAHDRQRISTGDYGPWEILEVLRTEWHWHNGGVEGSARGWYKKDDYEKLIAPVAIEYAQQNGNYFAFGWQGARTMLNRDKSVTATEPSGDVKGFISNRNLKEGYLDYLLEVGNRIIDRYNSRQVYMASGHAAPMDFDSPFLIVGGLNKFFSVRAGGTKVDLFGGVTGTRGYVNYDLVAKTGIADDVANFGSYFGKGSITEIVANNPQAKFLTHITGSLSAEATVIVRGTMSNKYFRAIYNGTEEGIENFKVLSKTENIANPGYLRSDGIPIKGQINEIILQKQ